MSIEDLLKPVKWLDKQVLTLYTRIGQHIPDEYLYKVTTGLGFLGLGGIGSLAFNEVSACVYGVLLLNIDMSLNMSGLYGHLPRTGTMGKYAIDAKLDGKLRLTRFLRFPFFLMGLSTLAKLTYELNVNDHVQQLTLQWHGRELINGLGFLSAASSMYLKDQDPKLLDRKPLLKQAYNWITEKLQSFTPQPVPEPVPAKYTTIDAL